MKNIYFKYNNNIKITNDSKMLKYKPKLDNNGFYYY